MILHEKTKQEFGYEFDTATVRSEFYCICDYCGKEFKRCKKIIVQCNKVVKKDSCGASLCKKTKSEEVNLLKYGVTNVGGTVEKIEKRKCTSSERYGNENYIASEECKKKNREKYGTDYPTQAEEVKRKVRETRVKTYGVDHHSKSEDYQNVRREKQFKKLGVTHHSKTEEFKEKLRKTFLEKYGKESIFHTEHFQNLLGSGNKKFGTAQNEINEFLSSLGHEFKPNRIILEGKEIDLYSEELKLGIEYCGLYWHHEFSPQPRNRSYHFDKYRQCLDKQVRLVTIFEDEWKLKNIQCKDFIRSLLHKFDSTVYARNCVVEEIDKESFCLFCDKHHIQGKCNSLVRFGIFNNGELLGVMSLGRHHRSNDLVLNRLCFKFGVQVLGGASKLFSRCLKWCEGRHEKIITWSDNRWSSGKIYEKLGFTLEKELPPDYSYVVARGGSVKRLSKQSCKKSNKGCPVDKTEREWMAELGYARMWDCGKKRWVFNLTGR